MPSTLKRWYGGVYWSYVGVKWIRVGVSDGIVKWSGLK